MCYMCAVCLSSHGLQYGSGKKPGIKKEKKKEEEVNLCTLLVVHKSSIKSLNCKAHPSHKSSIKPKMTCLEQIYATNEAEKK